MPPAVTGKVDTAVKPKRIVFDDDGDVVAVSVKTSKNADNVTVEEVKTESASDDEDDYFAKREKQIRQKQQEQGSLEDSQQKWYDVYSQATSNNSDDVVDMKDKDQMELYNLCKSSHDAEKTQFGKKNPTDARWLQTALHKGTAKDRANAGALLVTSNPLGNLDALSTLIGYTKLSNKASSDVIGVLTDLFQEVLLPPQRKLISVNMRGVDWNRVRKDTTMSKESKRRIYAYWYFENELQEQYFEFLKNLQHNLQSGQESNKNAAIVAATQLLAYAPEKEQMLLAMVVNKLGDPLAKVASKALHHLSEVVHQHPNMGSVIVSETEKLLFRNNISDRAQHFALCFLATIAGSGRPEVCTKLVHICFSFFKVLVHKGAVNNRTMQAILRCLQKAIAEAQPTKGNTEILSKDMQDTIYRLVHLADVGISVQTLGLLLQLVTVKTEKSDRFYNALYKKMLDMDITSLGSKTAAQFLHIMHRAIHIDANVSRAKAFIKRLLQMTLYMPAHVAAGCLIVVHKLLRSRKELAGGIENTCGIKLLPTKEEGGLPEMVTNKQEAMKTSEEENGVALDENSMNGEHEAELDSKNVLDSTTPKYDPYHRAPAFAGAEHALRTEFLLLGEHFHPTVKLFADSILNSKRITYYGDPLRDFGLPHFLERFAFKNPKKIDQQKAETPIMSHKRYVSAGSRGQSVKSLTKDTCTEDELFIFNFLEQKRQQAAMIKDKKTSGEKKLNEDGEAEEEQGLKAADVDDDEFDDYLDGYFGKKAKTKADEEDESELDFLKELGGEFKSETKAKKSKRKQKDDDEEDIDADWGDAGEDAEELDFNGDNDDDEISEDEQGSIDLNDDEDDDDGSISANDIGSDDNDDDADDDDVLSEPDSMSDASIDDEVLSPIKNKKKKSRAGMLDERGFAKKLKESNDMSSLFAAADEFSELLEETAKVKGQGTTNAVFNKDKSSHKQMKWEENRRSNSKTYMGKRKATYNGGGGSGGSKKFGKKRKQ